MPKSLYVLDGHYQIYRAFYAPFNELTSPAGEPTKAIHVFCTMLFQIIRERRPDYLAMTMDAGDETVFRTALDPKYKGNRDAPPESLLRQADRIVSIVEGLGIPIFVLPGFEADDLMATIVERLRDQDVHVHLVSRDKDLEQVLSERVCLYDPSRDELIDPPRLLESKGYTPAQAVEIQSLTGDSTDNVPGAEGVGPKTALKLILQYGTAEAAVQRASEIGGKLGERLRAFAASLPVTRTLVTLRRDVPFTFDLEACRLQGVRADRVRPIFDELGFTRLRGQLDALAADFPTSNQTSSGHAARDEKPDGASGPGNADAGTSRDGPDGADYRLVDTPEALADLAKQLARQPAFAFDTETTGLSPVGADLVGISFSWKAGEGWYIPVRAAVGRTMALPLVVSTLGPILGDPKIRKVGQNAKYDIVSLRQAGIDVAGLSFDTLIAAYLLDPMQRSHSLDVLAKTYFGHDMIPITDLIGKGKEQITMDQVDTQRVCVYAAEDADFTWRLYELLDRQIRGSHVERLFRETELPLVEVLAEMEHQGVALDTAVLKALSSQMGDRMIELTRQVQREAGHAFNVDSPKQLARVLFEEQGLPVIKKVKTGPSTDAETLEALVERTGHPIPTLLLEYRELSKLKGTYVDTLPTMICRRTGRVHTHFNQVGAITGRLSSNDPNLQNIPIRSEMGRRIRGAFIAGMPDHVLLSADYSQIELRLLAHLSKDRALLNAFERGWDVHRAVAAEVNGVPLDNVTPEQRSAAKGVNFGIVYGQTAFGLSRSLGISSHEAKAFIDRYFEKYSGVRAFITQCIDTARTNGYAETILGRRRPVPELQSHNRQQLAFGERIAVNTVVQGSAADLIKRAMVNVYLRMGRGLRSKLLIQVHDELVFETPRAHVEEEAAAIRDEMAHALPLDVPIVVDVHWGANWAEAK